MIKEEVGTSYGILTTVIDSKSGNGCSNKLKPLIAALGRADGRAVVLVSHLYDGFAHLKSTKEAFNQTYKL